MSNYVEVQVSVAQGSNILQVTNGVNVARFKAGDIVFSPLGLPMAVMSTTDSTVTVKRPVTEALTNEMVVMIAGHVPVRDMYETLKGFSDAYAAWFSKMKVWLEELGHVEVLGPGGETMVATLPQLIYEVNQQAAQIEGNLTFIQSAVTHAETATAQAGIATQQANLAGEEKAAAVQAKTVATEQAGIATQQANLAGEEKAAAVQAKTVATEQAGIATQQAQTAQQANQSTGEIYQLAQLTSQAIAEDRAAVVQSASEAASARDEAKAEAKKYTLEEQQRIAVERLDTVRTKSDLVVEKAAQVSVDQAHASAVAALSMLANLQVEDNTAAAAQSEARAVAAKGVSQVVEKVASQYLAGTEALKQAVGSDIKQVRGLQQKLDVEVSHSNALGALALLSVGLTTEQQDSAAGAAQQAEAFKESARQNKNDSGVNNLLAKHYFNSVVGLHLQAKQNAGDVSSSLSRMMVSQHHAEALGALSACIVGSIAESMQQADAKALQLIALSDQLDPLKVDMLEAAKSRTHVSVAAYVQPGEVEFTRAINEAGAVAKVRKQTLYIPSGEWPYEGQIDIHSSVDCDGVLVASGAGSPLIKVHPGDEPELLDPATLGTLVAGTAKLPILGKAGSVLVFRSTEILTPRFESAHVYALEEVAIVIDDEGTIHPPLEFTYTDLPRLSLKLFPPPERATIRGLKVRCDQILVGTSAIESGRHNVSFQHLELVAPPANKGVAGMGLTLVNCANVSVVGAAIRGFENVDGISSGGRLGYGIHVRNVTALRVNDCEVLQCKHGFASRNIKDVVIDGGTWQSPDGGPIDSHWGNGMVVKNAKILCNRQTAVTYTGSNISVLNNEIYNTVGVIGIRSDVPDCGGLVEVSGNHVEFADDVSREHFFVGMISATKEYGNYFGREIMWPDTVIIRRNRYWSQSSNLRYQRYNSNNFLHSQISLIEISENEPLRDSVSPRFVAGNNATASLLVADWAPASKNPVLRIRNEPTRNLLSVNVSAETGHTQLYGWELEFENVRGLQFRVDVDAAVRCDVVGGSVKEFMTHTTLVAGDPTRVPKYWYKLRQVEFDPACIAFRPSARAWAEGCHFAGDLSHSTTASNPQNLHNSRNEFFVYTQGNTALVGSDPARLPQLSGLVDAAVLMS